MKIPPHLFTELEADIRTVAAAIGVDIATADGGSSGLKTLYVLHDMVNRNRAFDDTHPGFQRGMWRRRLPFTGRPYCHLYDAGLNDSHIATALRHIKQNALHEKADLPQPAPDAAAA